MAREQKRLSRKELREDPLMTTLTQAQDWMELHGTKLIVGVIVIAIVIFGSVFYGKMRQSAEQEAAAALMNVGVSATDQSAEALVTPLEEVADGYKGTQAGAEAVFALAQLAMQQKDWDAALKHFERFSQEYGDEFIAGSAALMGEGVALENLGRYDEAAAAYDKAASRKDAKYAQEYTLLDAGRCWEKAGDPAAARDRYEQVVELKGAADKAVTRAKLNLAVLDAAR